jgi:hypothetical protein
VASSLALPVDEVVDKAVEIPVDIAVDNFGDKRLALGPAGFDSSAEEDC